ncbi:MAG: glycosyltransferase family 1 protein [Candidatus Firestonebacteria bacterium]|nr:glycosyltransferase family 1 protein [Candidatus Firestonebacteria bacterium]
MKYIKVFNVVPQMPEKLKPLLELAGNFWWGWNADAFNIFRHINADEWSSVSHNPIKFLSQVSQARLEELSQDEGFLFNLHRVMESFHGYLSRKTWFANRWPNAGSFSVAYFSAEFGINEGLPMYAGGLGVLAGDHLKSASDLGVPLVGVGLAYRQGYFRQYLNQDGWQQERYVENDFFNMPMSLMRDAAGNIISVEVEFPGRLVTAQVWKVEVGRVPLYLLDTNVPQNTPDDRNITAKLYVGDAETRLQQEIVLGIGGIKAIYKLGLKPTVTHMNEGHSAFLALERIAHHMDVDKLSYLEARELVAASSLFTTHTPVPAGNEVVANDMIERYLSRYYRKFGIGAEEFFGLGRINPGNAHEPFGMTVLALKISSRANGVARLHGEVSRRMWRGIWPNFPEEEIPIGSITNGVHVNSWISMEMSELFDRYLGPRWLEEPGDQKIWERISDIPSTELWRTHERRRERMVGYVRRRLRRQLADRGCTPEEVEMADQVLDPDALTIGFARRFATYKRATLLFKDLERLTRLLTDKNRPVQIILAGKAHPHDDAGKGLIQEVQRIARRADLRRHIVFLEDYDLNCAHYLVQGVDVWLNTPRRPMEASGTSGMKAVFNGAINLSILDGWWDEGYNGKNGWAIGRGEEYADTEYQDRMESAALFQILENEVIRQFYLRGSDDIPEVWVKLMKQSMTSLGPVFNTNRMVTEYTEKFYQPQTQRLDVLAAQQYAGIRELAAWKSKVRGAWGEIKIESVNVEPRHDWSTGTMLPVKAVVHLGRLAPEDVQVEIFYGRIDGDQKLFDSRVVSMVRQNPLPGGKFSFQGEIPCAVTGQHGLTVRVTPAHPNLGQRTETNLITWSE